jgi:deoxyribodipyrimidine photo-lyase
MPSFEPTLQAAHARLDAVNPDAYARTRNALDGAVTRLSPYLTHGFLSLREVFFAVHARHPLTAQHKLVFELGWRAYYRHVWRHLGDDIHRSLHTGLLPEDAYQSEMPADVLEARTGIPAIDLAVRELYATGYVHNHARMWLASYLVHLRKVHWRAGAQWMLGYLLDGDVASNHLSWQWVAGTGSSKPYLFNADNVAKYAPMQWHSFGTVIDTSYDALDEIARGYKSTNPGPGRANSAGCTPAPPLMQAPSPSDWKAPDAALVGGRDVWLLHPWSVTCPTPALQDGVVRIGIGLQTAHTGQPWSPRRWGFATQALQTQANHLWWTDAQKLADALSSARSVRWQADPHIDPFMPILKSGSAQAITVPALFAPVNRYCASFSKWWSQTQLLV